MKQQSDPNGAPCPIAGHFLVANSDQFPNSISIIYIRNKILVQIFSQFQPLSLMVRLTLRHQGIPQ